MNSHLVQIPRGKLGVVMRNVQGYLQVMEVRPYAGGCFHPSNLRKFPSLEAFKTPPLQPGSPLAPGTLVTTPAGEVGVVGDPCEGGLQVMGVDFTREHWIPAHLVRSTSPGPLLLPCLET